MVQLPSDASERGKSRSAASAAACASASVTPASQIITLLSASTSRIARRRWVETMISSPLKSGVWPPTSPVLPPCGTMGVRASLQKAATLRDLLGRAWPHQGKRLSLVEFARLDKRAGEERRVGEHVARPDDRLQGGEKGFSFCRVHLEEPPHAPFRSWPAKNGGDFDMGRKAKLVKRGHGTRSESRRR